MKKFTVAILGCGNRGGDTYGNLLTESGKFTVAALCDRDKARLAYYGARFGGEMFSDEEEFFAKKRADVLVVATMDRDHVRQGIRGLELGYDLLLEKPISDSKEECEALLAAQKRSGGKVLVCHVLRYAPAFVLVEKLLRAGKIGQLVEIQALEQVAYWHMAHSFVRGNWRRRDETAPMILAKCCHDLDLLQFYAGSRAKTVSSVGDLAYFKPENAPLGAQKRCLTCPLVETCPYSAKRIYIDTWKEGGCKPSIWPHIQITSAYPLTEKALYEALETGPYGRCVYACDNDVVDHQLVEIAFENGVKATLTMMGFTAGCGRIMRFHGTLGEIVLDELGDTVRLLPFGGKEEVYSISALGAVDSGHGGGDAGLCNMLYEVLSGGGTEGTSLAASIESHLMAFAAEDSRKMGGACISVHGN